MKRKILIAVAVIALIAAAYFIITGIQKNQSEKSSTYQTVNVEKGNLVGIVSATGTVEANQSAWLVWQAGGTVAEVGVPNGGQIAAGDILATLKKTTLPQNIILAEADLVTAMRALEDLKTSKLAAANAELAFVNAQKTFEDRQQERDALNYQISYETFRMTAAGPKLIKTKRDATVKEINEADAKLAVATAEMEDASREYERLKDGPDPEDIKAAEARVAAAQATINMQYIIAPFSGTVTDVSVKAGDVVNAGSAAIRVDDLDRLIVKVSISEVDINRIKTGQAVMLTFDAILNKEYNGKVVDVARVGSSDQGVVNFVVTVEIDDADEQVLPLMTAAVNITVTELTDVLLIPNRAVRLVDGKRVVYLLKNGQPVKTEIELGASSDLMSELISGDVKKGDSVILNPPTNFFMGPGAGGPMGN